MNELEEYRNWLGTFQGLEILDACHAIERFHERFPDLDDKIFYNKLTEGIEKINRVYNGNLRQYMIISFSTDLKIQIEKRENRKSPFQPIGVIATVLHRKEQPKNKEEEQEVYVEQIVKDFNHKPSDYTKPDNIDLFEESNYIIVEVE